VPVSSRNIKFTIHLLPSAYRSSSRGDGTWEDFLALNGKMYCRHVIMWLASGFGKTAYEVILLKLGAKIINLGVIGNLFNVQTR
jgi:hypothetical protein